MSTEKDNKLALFEGRQIRKAFHEGEWWFSIIDVVEALVGGDRPRKYWNDLKKKLLQEGYDQLSEKIGQLKMQSSDGKFYATEPCWARRRPPSCTGTGIHRAWSR